MYSIETEQSFDAAHFLSGYEGKCRNLHGHRWRVIARAAARDLHADGQDRDMVMDFGVLKGALKELTGAFDHALILEEGTLQPKTMEALTEENFRMALLPFRPTAERFARYFYDELKKRSIPVRSVTVYETPAHCATYEEDPT